MRISEAELQGLYQAHTRRSAEKPSACPTAEELVSLVCDTPDQSTRERIADHMMGCSACAQEFRLLRSLSPKTEELVIEHVPESAGILVDAPRRADAQVHGHGWRVPLALAASVLLAATALGVASLSLRSQSREFRQELAGRDQALTAARQQLSEAVRQRAESEAQVATLQQSLTALAQPQLNVPIVDLDPGDAFRGVPESRRKTVEVPAGAGLVTLILNVVGDTPYSDYGLEIVDSAGRVVWSGKGLKKSALNTFTVAIPRQVVSSGSYRIKLYGLRGSGRVLIEDYALRFKIL
jgi:hypothetical protein